MMYPILVGPMTLPSFISLLFICKILLHYLFLLWYSNKLRTVQYRVCNTNLTLLRSWYSIIPRWHSYRTYNSTVTTRDTCTSRLALFRVRLWSTVLYVNKNLKKYIISSNRIHRIYCTNRSIK